MGKVKNSFPCSDLLSIIQEGILILRSGRIIFVNDHFAAWTGFSTQELLETELKNIVIPEDHNQVLQILEIDKQTLKKITQMVLNIIPKNYKDNKDSKNNKERITLGVNATVITSGEWANDTLLTLRNTTSEKIFKQLLNSSQQHLQEIIETFPDIYYVTDAVGNLIKVSPSVTAILGYEPSEVLGSKMSSYYSSPELRDKIVAKIVAGRGQYVRAEAPLRHKSGRYVWFKTRARMLLDSEGNITGLEGLARDATVEKEIQDLIKKREVELMEIKHDLESKVKQQTEEILQKERLWLQKSRHAQMGEMISSIAHQWRQPLNVLSIWINNFSSLYKEGNLKQEDIDLFSERSGQLIGSMSETIDQFRGFFKHLASSDIFNISNAISSVLPLIVPSLEQVGINLLCDLTPHIWVQGYANEFGQVLINLLTNAKESCVDRKIINPKIEIRLCIKGDFAALEIVDNAGGIPSELIDKIFDPYFTTKQKGTGIGLYMSKNIIERHMQGSITVENYNQGACFKIKLPFSISEAKIAGSGDGTTQYRDLEVKNEVIEEQKIGHLRILLVDDHAESRTVFLMMLKKKGIEVRAAASAQEGIDILSEFKPDLIISDILMPEEDGCSMIRRIRALKNTEINSIPAIALSAHVDSEEIQQALEAGFNKYLTKPVKWNELINLIIGLTQKS